MVNRSSSTEEMTPRVAHPEGRLLLAMIERTTPRPIDIARAGDFSRQYVSDVLAGRKRASQKFIEACRSLGLPVELIWRTRE